MSQYRRDVTKLKTIEGKMAWLLETYPHLKDANYNEVFAKYMSEFHNLQISPRFFANLTALESISRAKRKLVQKNPDKYGGRKHDKVVAKATHQVAIEEWVTQN